MNSILISSKELTKLLNHPNLILLNASVKPVTSLSNLPTKENRTNPHVKFFDLKNKFSDQDSNLPNMMPKKSSFEKQCQILGINQNSIIVVFDDLGIYSSPRVWWMFKEMGHQKVYILNEKLPEQLTSKYNKKRAYHKQLGTFKITDTLNSIIDYDFIKSNHQSNSIIIFDARSSERFKGIAKEPRPKLQSGCIPNSYNIPYQLVLNNKYFKPKNELTAIFNQFNHHSKQVIFSCGSGLTAAILLVAYHLAFDPTKTYLYDGSWCQWAEKNKLFIN